MNIDNVEVNGIINLQYNHIEDEFPSIGMEFLCVGEVELDIEKYEKEGEI